jgi:hypothetical protein
MAFAAAGALEGAGAAEGAAGAGAAAEGESSLFGKNQASNLFGKNSNHSLAQSIIGNPAKVFGDIAEGAAGLHDAAANMPKYDPQSNSAENRGS